MGALDDALAELRREYLDAKPPAAIETSLRVAARSKRNAVRSAARSAAWMWGIAGTAAAMALLGLALWLTRGAPSQQRIAQANPKQDSPKQIDPKQDSAVRPDAAPHGNVVAVKTSPSNRKPKPALRVKRSPRRVPGSETARSEGSFVALPGSEGLPLPSEASIYRVRMAKGDLQQFGFNVPPGVFAEMIHADLVLGEDGMPRAIRLVR